MCAFRGLADAGIQAVGRVEPSVESGQFRLRVIEVADIVLGRIFGAALVEQIVRLI